MSMFRPARGGHAPGHLRGAFSLAVSRDATSYHGPGDHFRSMSWLTGQLWNCTDVMPAPLCADLQLPSGSTYAQAARLLRASQPRLRRQGD